MSLIFKKGINLKEVFADPKNREIVGNAITNYLREGFYDDEGKAINPATFRFTAEMIKTLPLEKLLFINSLRQKLLRGEYISAGDITTGAAVGIKRKEIFIPEVPADTQYLEIFRTVTSDKAGETYEQAEAGITFSQLKLGEKPKLDTITHAKDYVPNLKWGSAFGFHREWIDDNEVWKMEDVIRQAKIAAYDAKATFMYGLIAAAAWGNINYATSWIKTLNTAYAQLKRAKKLKPNQRPIVVCTPEKLADILQAIKDTMVKQARGERLVLIPDVIDTAYLLETDLKAYVLIPKERFILQEREALRTETDKDIMMDAEAYAWYFRMNGIILDVAYGRKITYT